MKAAKLPWWFLDLTQIGSTASLAANGLLYMIPRLYKSRTVANILISWPFVDFTVSLTPILSSC